MLCYALREVEFGRQHIENFRAGRANSRLSALITAFVGLQSIDDFQVKRIDYCLCRPSLCSQNLVDRNSTNSGLSVPAGLSACFSYFLPKQFNNVFFTPDFLHGARTKKLAFFGTLSETRMSARRVVEHPAGQRPAVRGAGFSSSHRAPPKRLSKTKRTTLRARAKSYE
jgi:hypothetical protein